MKTSLGFLLLLGFLLSSNSHASPKSNRYKLKTENFTLNLVARSPEQIAAFYEARGFPKQALKQLESMCFFTVGFHNRRKDIIWLDLASWKLVSNGKTIRRYHRDELKTRWQSMNLPLRLQSTFRWTLMPEVLDFRPDEHEGGNIVIPRSTAEFDLHASFKTGKNKQGGTLTALIKNIQCAENP